MNLFVRKLTLLDDRELTFGKYNGDTPNEIALEDPQYLVWMYDTLNTKFCTKRLRNECEEFDEDSWEDEKEQDEFYGFDGWEH